jgi:branched-chain amino acid transport system substrate-binding protein
VRRWILAALVAPVFVVAACGDDDSGGGSSGGSSGEEIVIGTSVPMTGPLGGIGQLVKAGYEEAVNEVNAQGGVARGDSKSKVKLVVLDNKSIRTSPRSRRARW